MFLKMNHADISKDGNTPKMGRSSKLSVSLQPQWAPLLENMQSNEPKVED